MPASPGHARSSRAWSSTRTRLLTRARRAWPGCAAGASCIAALMAAGLGGGPAAVALGGPVEEVIRPLLLTQCGPCHGPDAQESGLRLDLRHRALEGGDFGPVILPGDAAGSELVRRIESHDPENRMPPDGERIPAAEVALVRDWIDSGAEWPETEADRLARLADRDPRLDHWAWRPVVRPEMPPARPGWPAGNEIDRFVQAALAEKGLEPAAEADRRTLVRRLSFDLLGLPPAPEDLRAFETDTAPDAWPRLVDRLLASPHYGERWARHWLDIAHYADTHGFERDQLRSDAWRYRDWVIDALNRDLPYDEFLRRQIAGDLLGPDDPDRVVATGFLAAGPWDFVGQVETKSDLLRRQARADDLDDMLTQVMTAACSVSINCARCHDHKLDPVPQREYYALAAVFAGVRRADAPTSRAAETRFLERRAELTAAVAASRARVHALAGRPLELADLVGGGDGRGSGRGKTGIDPRTGRPVDEKPRGPLDAIEVNRPQPGPTRFVNAVFVPHGPGPVPVTTSGLLVQGLPATSRAAWDAIRHGPVARQHATTLGATDYATAGHSLVGLHANAGITFDLAELLGGAGIEQARFTAMVGYGGTTPEAGAEYFVFLDGVQCAHGRIGRDDGGSPLDLPLPPDARYLTLVATDGGNGIGMDQVFFGDPLLVGSPRALDPAARAALEAAEAELATLERELASLQPPARFFGIASEAAPPVRVLLRGNPEAPGAEVGPGTISAVGGLETSFGVTATPEGARRQALATWLGSPKNPLPARSIVNRLWHHHFGTGIVDTPNDFGLGGGRPSHPELLDWLATELIARDWSLKSLHRLICTSHAYRQGGGGARAAAARAVDADNRLVWRRSPRRLDAESIRDATLAVSGCLNTEMHGPGYRDFDYEEAYAPVYRHVVADQPALWRRSIYRFVVRSTPHTFLTTLDCPNPANLAPDRLETTTALQSLALLNNDFMLLQAGHWAARLEREAGPDPVRQVRRAFELSLARQPDEAELAAALHLVESAGLAQVCRMLLNCNEFLFVD